jgi:hypothetical protein
MTLGSMDLRARTAAVTKLLSTLWLFSACAASLSQPKPLPAHLDPSNPDAPEAAPVAASTTLAAEAEARPTKQPPPAAREAPPEKQIYSCPMHPEVRSDTPGTCPKCGMKLVPAKPEPPAKQQPPPERTPTPEQDHSQHGGGAR